MTDNISIEKREKLNKLLHLLCKNQDSYVFLEPVDWEGLGLFDYPEIIKKPMDLSTVRQNLNQNQYETLNECLEDIALIWTNCKSYNIEESDIYMLAVKMSNFTKKKIDALEILKSDDDNIEEEENKSNDQLHNKNTIIMEDKIRLGDKVKGLSHEGLEKFINIVQTLAPKSIDDQDQSKIKINVDIFDKESFHKIETEIDLILNNIEPPTKKLKL